MLAGRQDNHRFLDNPCYGAKVTRIIWMLINYFKLEGLCKYWMKHDVSINVYVHLGGIIFFSSVKLAYHFIKKICLATWACVMCVLKLMHCNAIFT